jgi:hypothetical protein
MMKRHDDSSTFPFFATATAAFVVFYGMMRKTCNLQHKIKKQDQY